MVFIIFFIITIIYSVLISYFIYGISLTKEVSLEPKAPKTSFSILIPFRNESKNLGDLLQTILKLDYPKNLFEVIFIDDESSDNSKDIICLALQNSGLNYLIIDNERFSNSPKKDAISKAITIATHDWIITTDADCFLPEFWLSSFNNFIETQNPKMIVAPVTFVSNGSFFEEFQYLDFLSLQSATIGGFGIQKPFLCNGANLIYSKDIFEELNGFVTNNSIASGDDVFLLETYLKNYPKDVHYLKSYDVIVATKPEKSFKDLIQQRARWAAKTSSYNNWFAKLVGLIILLMNAAIIDAILFAFIGLISWNELALILISKYIIDFIFLYKTSLFFKKTFCVKFYLINAVLYSFFTVYIAFYSMLFNYKWKGRFYNK